MHCSNIKENNPSTLEHTHSNQENPIQLKSLKNKIKISNSLSLCMGLLRGQSISCDNFLSHPIALLFAIK